LSIDRSPVRWVRVTPSSPCRHCERGDERCAASADGRFEVCYRANTGSGVEKRTKDGATYFRYDLQDVGDRGRRPAVPSLRVVPGSDRARPETLHRVYSALLANARTRLTDENRAALIARGFDGGDLDRRQYRSHPGREGWKVAEALIEEFGERVALSVPGIYLRNTGGRMTGGLAGREGLLIPVRNPAMQVVAISNAPDDRSGPDCPKYLWLSSRSPRKGNGPGPGAPVHCPLPLDRSESVVRVTEGSLKADLAQALSGLPTIGLAGVDNWRSAIATLGAIGAGTARLAFDSDWKTKPPVARALSNFAAALRAAGVVVEVEEWDPACGKGVDDVLAADHPTRVLAGDEADRALAIAAGVAGEPGGAGNGGRAGADPGLKARVSALLDSADAWSKLYDADGLLAELAVLEQRDAARFRSIVSDLRTRKINRAPFSAADFRAAMKRHQAEAKRLDREQKRVEGGEGEVRRPTEYRDGGDHILIHGRDQNGVDYQDLLATFSARIVEVVTTDDGAITKRRLVIEGTASGSGGLVKRAEIPASKFEDLKWVVPELGPEFRIEVGPNFRDHVRSAIQCFSAGHMERTSYGQLGFRKIDGSWAFLHRAGAIGEGGNDPGVATEIEGTLAGFVLPDPPSGVRARDAIRASLGIFRLASPDRPGSRMVAAATLCATYRAPIDFATYTLQFNGPTGSLKSSAAALAQQHYGPGMDYAHLPAGWKSTPLYLMEQMFRAANCVLVIDDFVPSGDDRRINDQHAAMETVFRSVGNHQGRGRLNSDATPQPDRPPRCLPISTGEDRCRVASADARSLPIAFVKDDPARGIRGTIDPEILSGLQADAGSGIYAEAMAAYLAWLSPRLDGIRDGFRQRVIEQRALAARPGDHGRTPEIIADLIAGFDVFLSFAIEAGAIDGQQAEEYRADAWDGLMEASADLRADRAEESDAGDQFIRLIAAALQSGAAHLVDLETGDVPDGIELASGWRRTLVYDGPHAGKVPIWEPWPNAERIGWTDGTLAYLHPDNAYAIVRKFAARQGVPFPASKRAASKSLCDTGKLVGVTGKPDGQGKVRYASRITVPNQAGKPSVLPIACCLLWPDGEGEPVAAGHDSEGTI